jgi:pimeloyl-ACP methyl ester carboxylesterase
VTSYLVAGHGKPVILLHGMGAASGFWRQVMAGLAHDRLVIAPDILGFGRTMPDSPANPPDFISWLTGFLDALGIPSASIVGHSLGAAIAVRFTLENPGRVEKLILVGAIGFGVSALGVLAAGLFMVPSNPVTRPILRRILSSRPGLIPSAPRTKKRKASFDRGLAMRIMRASGWNGLPTFPPDSLGRISQPTLLLWGEKDRIVPVSIARRMRDRLPQAVLQTVSSSGHMPFLENPVEFEEKLSRFLGN